VKERKNMTHRINTRGLLGALACGTLAIAAAGCRDDATHPITGSGAASGAARPSGDDIIVGLGNNSVTLTAGGLPAVGAKLNDDFCLSNGFVSIGVDAVGMDRSSPVLNSTQSAGVPLQSTLAPSGGNLVDISIVGADNDQWVTNGMGFIGASLIGGQGSFLPPDNLVVWFEIIPDTSPAITALGFPQFVESQGTLRRLAVRGVILNNTTRTAANAAVDGAITNGADLIKTNGPAAAIPASFRENVPDRFQILCHTSPNSPAPGGNTFVPIFVTQVYALSEGNAVLTETTVVQHVVPNGNNVRIGQAAEFIGVGLAGNSSLDTLAGGPMWVDPLAVLVGGGFSVPAAQATLQNLVLGGLLPQQPGAPAGTVRPSVTAAELNRAIRLAGNPQPFPSDNYGQGVVPYISFIGRGVPEVSYTYFDAIAGNVVLNRDPRQAAIALAVMLRSDSFVPADITATATVNEAAVGRLAWARKIAVGRVNDADSSVSQAVRVTRDAPRAATFTPNYMFDVVSLQGTLANAPEGTIVTISETTPTFFNSFNPNGFTPASLPGSLTGSTNTSSILGVGLPSAAVIPGSLRLEPISLLAETLRTTVRVGPGGSFVATLPVGAKFQTQNPFNIFQAPTIITSDTTTLYNFRAHLPGGGAPVTIATNVTVTVGAGVVQLGTTDVGAGVGTFSYTIEDATPSVGRIPGVITILTSGGVTPTADFSAQSGIEEGFERSDASGNSAVTASGSGRMTLAVGTYTVVASAGFDYETDTETVVITAGGTESKTFVLTKVQNVSSRAFTSADFHVHSGESPDCGVPGPDRTRSLLAHGVEVYAQTEHDKIGDATGAIAQVGATERPDIASRLKHMHGVEYTTDLPWLPGANPAAKSQCLGHYNAFPLVYRPENSRGGAPQDEIRPNAIVYLGMRMQDEVFVATSGPLAGDTSGNEIITLNHPRSTTSTSALDGGDGLFSNLAFAFPAFGGGPLASPFGRNSDEPGGFLPIGNFGIQLLVDATGNPSVQGSPSLLQVAGILRGGMGFDTMEVLNGSQTIDRYIQHRADWFAMLNRGVIKTAIGTSDNHRIDDRRNSKDTRFDTMFMGIARTMLVTSEGPADLTNDEVVALVKPSYNTPTATAGLASGLNPFGTLNPAVFRANRMKAVVSTGPMLSLSLAGTALTATPTGSPIGASVSVTAGVLDITVTVTGPTWVMSNCTEARIIVNGTQTATVALSGGTTSKTATFTNIDLSVDPTGGTGLNADDTWVVVEAGQPLADVAAGVQPTGAYAQVYPNVPVVAFTNPIFFDRDGNTTTFDACRNDE